MTETNTPITIKKNFDLMKLSLKISKAPIIVVSVRYIGKLKILFKM